MSINWRHFRHILWLELLIGTIRCSLSVQPIFKRLKDELRNLVRVATIYQLSNNLSTLETNSGIWPHIKPQPHIRFNLLIINPHKHKTRIFYCYYYFSTACLGDFIWTSSCKRYKYINSKVHYIILFSISDVLFTHWEYYLMYFIRNCAWEVSSIVYIPSHAFYPLTDYGRVERSKHVRKWQRRNVKCSGVVFVWTANDYQA